MNSNVSAKKTVKKNAPKSVKKSVKKGVKAKRKHKDTLFRDLFGVKSAFLELYNGEEDKPEMEVLKLSDLFAEYDMEYPINLELTVRVYNINKGHNAEFARRCVTLNGYEVYTAKVREYSKTMKFGLAVDRATEECIKDGILADYLSSHRKAVRNMLTAEWKLEDALKIRGEEERLEGQRDFIKNMYQGGFTIAEIVRASGFPEKEVKKILGLK